MRFEMSAVLYVLPAGPDPSDLSETFPLPDPEAAPKTKSRFLPEGKTDRPRPDRYDYRKRRVAVSTTNRFRAASQLKTAVIPSVMVLSGPTAQDVLDELHTAILSLETEFGRSFGAPPEAVTLLVHSRVVENDGAFVGAFSAVASDAALPGSAPYHPDDLSSLVG